MNFLNTAAYLNFPEVPRSQDEQLLSRKSFPLHVVRCPAKNADMYASFLSVLFATALLPTSQNNSSDLSGSVSGHVISDSNTPLRKVSVSRYWWPDGGGVLTDVEGQFVIRTDSPFDRRSGRVALRFSLEGYQPATRVLRLDSTDSVIILVKASDSPWKAPSCPTTTPRLGLGAIGYTLPRGTKTKHYGGDALTEMIRFGKYTMGHSWGLNWSYGFPTEPSFFEKVSQISERDLLFNESIGAEYRGTRPDGTYFRWIGTVFETLAYNNVTKDAAIFFDRVIDSLCSTR